jgi:DNA-binding NarL/FixJ family response regulator
MSEVVSSKTAEVIAAEKLARIEQLLKLLSRQQAEVVRLFLAGLSMGVIAEEMDVSYETVKTLMKQIHVKYAACGLTLERQGGVRRRSSMLRIRPKGEAA